MQPVEGDTAEGLCGALGSVRQSWMEFTGDAAALESDTAPGTGKGTEAKKSKAKPKQDKPQAAKSKVVQTVTHTFAFDAAHPERTLRVQELGMDWTGKVSLSRATRMAST